MNRAMWLIDAISRRDFLKRAGAGVAVSALAPSTIGGSPKYWEVNKADRFLMSPKSWDTAKPYFGRALGQTTKSGIVVNSPEKMFVPDELYQDMVRLSSEYAKGYSSPNFGQAMSKLSSLENEVEHGIRLVLNPNLDHEMADRQAKKKAEAEAGKKAEAQKAREHRELMHRFHQKHQARRSRMDYAGGSEDTAGVDYTTLEHKKVSVDRILGESHNTLVDLATKVVYLVGECGGRKRQLAQVLAKLRKIDMPDHVVDLALSGDIMSNMSEVNLVGALEKFLSTYRETQEDLDGHDDPDSIEVPARLPVIDAAITIIDRYGKLTDEIYEAAFLSVSGWEGFEGFTEVSPRPHIDEKYEFGYGP